MCAWTIHANCRLLCRPCHGHGRPNPHHSWLPSGRIPRAFFSRAQTSRCKLVGHGCLPPRWDGAHHRQSGNEPGASDVVAEPRLLEENVVLLLFCLVTAEHRPLLNYCGHVRAMETGCCIVATTVSLFRSVATRNGNYYLEHVMNTSSFLCAISCESDVQFFFNTPATYERANDAALVNVA
jgi:hypothetical protein